MANAMIASEMLEEAGFDRDDAYFASTMYAHSEADINEIYQNAFDYLANDQEEDFRK